MKKFLIMFIFLFSLIVFSSIFCTMCFAKYSFTHDIIITDINISLQVGIYSKLFDCNNDGIGDTLVLNNYPNFSYSGNLITDFNNEENNERQLHSTSTPVWRNEDYLPYITKVVILNEIIPIKTSFWFYNMKNLTDIENIININTKNCTSMEGMFFNCFSLSSLDISHFDTQNVTSMVNMFGHCKTLSYIDVSNFNTKNVQDLSFLFIECYSLEYLNGLSSFDTSKVKNMSSFFCNCKNLKIIDLSSFSTENLISISSMFEECNNLKTIYASDKFDLSNISSSRSKNMFKGCMNLVGGNGSTQIFGPVDKTYAKIDKPGQIGYFTEKLD